MILRRFFISGGALIYAIIGVSLFHNPKSWFHGYRQSIKSSLDLDFSRIYLQIDRNSTLSNDLVRIWHEPLNGQVCVQLRKDARCPDPALLGRLSGPSLALLEWNIHDKQSSSGNVLCGSYGDQWLDAGDYFIEIIVLYCHDFGIKTFPARKREKGITTWFNPLPHWKRKKDIKAWFNQDLAPTCVENAEYNRITTKRSHIVVPISHRGARNFRIGRWIRRPELPSRPLFTRHQPTGCVQPSGLGYRPLDPLPEWCPMVTDRDKANHSTGTFKGLPEYNFHWGEENKNQTEITTRLQNIFNQSRSTIPRICVVGDSHGRFIVTRSARQLGVPGLVAAYIKSQWANTSRAALVKQKKCEVLVFQIGQWPASVMSGGRPYSFEKYYKAMKTFIEAAKNKLRDVPGLKVYLTTVDMGPLMGAINLCKDWRTPTVMSAYSYGLQLIASESKKGNVKYIDTNFIIQTHWDGHYDWIHLQEEVRYHKTIFILAHILKDIGLVFCEECLPSSLSPA